MKFSQMPYSRADIAAIEVQAKDITKRMEAAADYSRAREVFLEWEELESNKDTLATVASIRHTIDTTDEFYDRENSYYDEIGPVFDGLKQDFMRTVLSSRFRPQFEKDFGALYFTNAGIALRAFKPEMIPGLQEENRLSSEYVKLLASAQIEFDGKKNTVSEMTPYMQSGDRTVRKGAWNALGSFFKENGEKFDRFYADLVETRAKLASQLGHETFTPLGYDRMMRNSYTPEDIEKFREGVREYIVPVAAKLKREQAKRTGCDYPLTYYDNNIQFINGNAKPFGTPDEIMAHGQKLYAELSPETKEFMDFMTENELFDVLAKKGKAEVGYCTALKDYRCPFIFANFNGTAHDVEVITHEAGHAFAYYMCRNVIPAESAWPTAESCEIHSMTMEFFAWPWCEGFFGKDTQKFLYQHLADAITFIPYGTMVDHFQHEMYANPDMAPARRHEVWASLEAVYRPWIKDTETTFFSEGRFWQRQHHIYEMPFYYIDYCLAQTVALQFWTIMQSDRQEAWRRYMNIVNSAGKKTFTELVASAEMRSPFDSEALRQVAEAAVNWLENFDSSALD